MSTDVESHSLLMDVVVPTGVARAFALWSDQDQLQKWWGPPEYPCQVIIFDFRPGGHVRYVMTGPDGTRYYGWWEVIAVDAPHRIQLRDGFGESPDMAEPNMPVAMTEVTFTDDGDHIRMRIHSRYSSAEELQSALDLGMEEGFGSALAQIDDLLASTSE